MLSQIKKAIRQLYYRWYSNPTMSRVRAAVSSLDAEFHQKYELMQGEMITTLTPDLSVLSGPFKGMKYPFLEAAGSALLPKLLGTYELELHPCIKKAIRSKYFLILDIGAAEGYYAVGLAFRIPTAKIAAFDIDLRARALLSEMIKKNNVDGQVAVEGLCDTNALRQFADKEGGLVISDCEGCELGLFGPSTISAGIF